VSSGATAQPVTRLAGSVCVCVWVNIELRCGQQQQQQQLNHDREQCSSRHADRERERERAGQLASYQHEELLAGQGKAGQGCWQARSVSQSVSVCVVP